MGILEPRNVSEDLTRPGPVGLANLLSGEQSGPFDLRICQHSDRIISWIAYPVWQFGDAGLSFGPVDCLSHVSCLMFEALGLRALDEQVTELHFH